MITYALVDKYDKKDLLESFSIKNDEGDIRAINLFKDVDGVEISINIHRYMTDDEGFRVDTGIMDHIIVGKAENINDGLCITRYVEACRKDDSKFKRQTILDYIFYGKSKEAIQMMNVIENNL